MIGKILPHRESFGPLTGYLLYGRDRQTPQRVEWVAMRNLEGAQPETAHLVMQATANQSRRTKKPRQHVIVSWAHEDSPTPEQMIQIMDQTLEDLGLQRHQAMYVAHNDTRHQHCHAIINRVHPDTGKAAKDSYERLKLRKSLMRQEQARGLRQTPYLSRGRQPLREFSEIEIAKRTGQEEMLRFSKQRCMKLREELAYSFHHAHGWASLDGMLNRRGYKLVISGRGVRIVRGFHYAKLSDALPRKQSAKGLAQKWGRFAEYWYQQPARKKKRKRKQVQREVKKLQH